MSQSGTPTPQPDPVPPSPQPTVPPQPPTPRRRRRRWPWVVGAIVVVLLLVVWSVPYLLSTDAGTGLVVSIANQSIKGTLGIADLSLSWLGECRVSGMSLSDPAGQEVVNVASVVYTPGVWGAAKDWAQLGRVTVASPQVTLYLDKNGRPSLLDAIAPRVPSPEREPEPLPKLHGELALTGGTIRVVTVEKRTYDIRNLNVTFGLATFDDLTGEVDFQTGDQGQVQVSLRLKNLTWGPTIAIDQAEGELAVHTKQPVAVGPAAALVAGKGALEGDARLDLTAKLAKGVVTAEYKLRADRLQSSRAEAKAVRPLDLGLSGSVTASKQSIQARVELSGQAGTLRADASYTLSGAAPALSADDVMAAVFEGKPIALPDVALDCSGRIDLPKLAEAAPALIRLVPGVTVTGGEVRVASLSLRGGAQPTVQAEVALKGLAARKGQQVVTCEPVTLSVRAALEEKKGLAIHGAMLKSEFGNGSAKGTATDLSATFGLQLARLHERLGQIFELGDLPREGTVSGTLTLARAQDKNRVNVGLDAKAQGVVVESKGRRIETRLASIQYKGYLRLDGQRPVEAVADSVQMTVDNDLRVGASGRFGFTDRTFRVRVSLDRADLAGLVQRANGFVGGGLPACQGSLTGTVRMDRVDAGRVDFVVSVAGRDLRVGSDGSPAPIRQAAIEQTGRITMVDGRATRIQVDKLTISADQAVAATGQGWYAIDTRAFGGALDLTRADVARLLAVAAGLGVKVGQATRYAGTLTASTKVARAGGDAPITSSGQGQLLNPQVDGKPIMDKPVTFTWSGMKLDPGMKAIELALAKLDSPVASATAEGVRVGLGDTVRVEGQVKLSADVAGCLTAAQPVAGWDKVPPVAGRLEWSGTGRVDQGRVRVAVAGSLTGLRVGEGAKAVKEDRVTFSQTAVLDNQAETITVEEVRIDSGLVSVKAAGTVRRFKHEQVMDLSGTYEAAWDRVMAVVHNLAPKTADTIALTGTTSGPFKVTGPVNKPDLKPSFHDLSADTKLGWASATVYGMKLGPATFAPSLAQGQLTVPDTVIAASEGKLLVAGVVDLRGDDPVVRITKKRKVIDRVRITPEFAQKVLRRINPVFAGSGSVEGLVSLEVENLVVPLGKDIERRAQGTAQMTIEETSLEPSVFTRLLLELGNMKVGDRIPMAFDPIKLVVKDGRLQYEGLRAVLSKTFDPIFSGSVGLDDTLDLVVSLPVTEELLRRGGVRGRAADYARLLTGSRVKVPLGGTLTNARLDLTKMDLRPLVERAAKALLKEEAKKGLEGLLRGRKKRDAKPAQPGGSGTKKDKPADDKKKRGGLLDTLLDRVRKRKD